MNRLQLCQRLVMECGISGSITSTLNQTGEFNRVVTWIDQAWNDLQALHDDWDWLRSSYLLGHGAAFPTTAGGFTYPLGSGSGTVGIDADVFGKWAEETFRISTTVGPTILVTEPVPLYITTEDGIPIATGDGYPSIQDETFLDIINYDAWRNGYMFGAMRTVQTRPVAVAIGPDKSVCLGPPSNGLYSVTADFFFAPFIMTGNDSEPVGLPKQFHMLIVYLAMEMYALYEAAPEVLTRAQAGQLRMLDQLENTNMPRAEMCGALF